MIGAGDLHCFEACDLVFTDYSTYGESFFLGLLIAGANVLSNYYWPSAGLLRMALIAQRSILLQQIGLLLNLVLKTQS